MHEWIERRGGSENVLEAIAGVYPDSEILTPWINAADRFSRFPVHETWLARSPLRGRKAAAALVLPTVWRSSFPRGRSFDWILVSSHLFAHHLRVPSAVDAPKLVYVHSPARYVWNPELDPRGAGLPQRAASVFLKPVDRWRAKEATSIAANSRFVRARVEQAWRRDAVVIPPPVAVEEISAIPEWSDTLGEEERSRLDRLPERFILGASRFVSYKQLDVVIRAGQASGIPVVLAGSGPERRALERIGEEAGVPVSFVDSPSDGMLYALYQRALVYVFPPVEDFGIMPVEAMAAGTPVIANAQGGASESVEDGVSGRLLPRFDAASLADAVAVAEGLDRAAVQEGARRFSRAAFEERIRNWVDEWT